MLCFLAVGAASCKDAEVMKYEHAPSLAFYKKFDFGSSELAPFKEDGLLFVVDVKQATYEEYFLWLEVYSKTPGRALHLKTVDLVGTGWNKQLVMNQEVRVEDAHAKSGLLKKTIKLGALKGEDLGFMRGSDKIIMTITFMVDGKEGQKSFVFQKKVEHHAVFPT